MIRAANGKRLKAKTVFAHAIKFLKEEALQMIRMETKDEGYKMEDIQWVLTVPAIWTPKAKQFMREAAYEVGKRTETLKRNHNSLSAVCLRRLVSG